MLPARDLGRSVHHQYGKGHTFTVYFQRCFHLSFSQVRQSAYSRCDNRLLLLFYQLVHGALCKPLPIGTSSIMRRHLSA